MKVAFKQVDVFTSSAFNGNPLAVIMDAQGLSDSQLAAIARWTNLSETTFVLPPQHREADYRVRIFTVEGELPFAGHPTLGTAHALLEAGWPVRTPGEIVQECGVGNVTVKIDDAGLAFAAPAATLMPWQDARMSNALNSNAFDLTQSPTVVDMGIRWLLIPMVSAEAVLALQPDVSELQRLIQHAGVSGIMPFGRLPADEPEQYEVRGLLVENGSLTEDPVTGSANACLARYFAAAGQTIPYRVRQGTALQRAGRVSVTFAGETIWIGGTTVTVIDGTITL
ncbi:PhzF family phenazine biosynthesis protein [Pantoea sp. Bo_2]|uniref:PhzF family phenazine biosynthesis protein n=1 Tax=Candidatus Pantoea gossypiicola TaxID=2608008 RepID=A0AB34CKF3_9GAMM|nr:MULTISPECIES: PhzF family phenazine biosynthesis protein [Pantoea]KAA5931071.1 PhzF family phenazine biosynthesis protein [Pantoea sp. VH_8]KAA5935738.1 PhzF family phenazine biosynthesis protein [Pantoea sp. VH_4]KAA5936932.1 PhzF family phenazine biosynthesis protein [Pantoea sp. VH_3]KAA5944879.1 PhzF family phenazine biosynthesis protein [Pantoea sp. VH_25]KAA5950628.1 PhzF family phenazine biosynthesis protein [Pantoea sp. VH_24]